MFRRIVYATAACSALVLSAVPAMANSTIPTGNATPSTDGVTAVFGSIAAGLALIWGVRKVISLLNKS